MLQKTVEGILAVAADLAHTHTGEELQQEVTWKEHFCRACLRQSICGTAMELGLVVGQKTKRREEWQRYLRFLFSTVPMQIKERWNYEAKGYLKVKQRQKMEIEDKTGEV